MGQWQWPQPILLKPIEEGPLQVRVWNPKLYPSDRSHRMPIITPAYPSMCSTHNVTLSTQSIMTAEFKRAAEIVDKVFVGSAPWSELFAPHDFFSKYRYYLQITASSGSADVQLKWSGTVESRVRQLVMKLEYVDTLVLAHPYVKGFDRTSYCLDEVEQRAVSIGEVPPAVAARTEADLVEGQGGTVWTTTFYIGLMIERKPPGANGPRKLDISYPTNEFTKLVKMWDKYEPETMGVIVRYIKSTALPAYVHEGKEPEAPKVSGLKRTKTKAAAPSNGIKSPSPAAAAATAASVPGVDPSSLPGGVPAPPNPANASVDSLTDDDLSSERLNKKLRSSSFVPEGSAPLPGVSSAPTPPPTSETSALAAATLATNGGATISSASSESVTPAASGTASANGTEGDESSSTVTGAEGTVSPDGGVQGSLPGLTSVSA
ncbi:Nucleotidyltransferase, class I, C-terminal-like protein [Leucosporidium creatinivorum]|uniref:polynucleotide adenylyltransferase n=1 Tax=Leucosporidium creatinivorum TaxID=106004 RepID=A0A1Y2ECP7_9BASI|nr:Nucleotidyltransferase, class I, C-terminal-like protein [Leucosporidium creatinivorum]